MSTQTEPRKIEVSHGGRTGVVVATAHIGCTCPEWPTAWGNLVDLTAGDYCETNLDSLEKWQYMSTVKVAFPILNDAMTYGCDCLWLHEFRHRDRPAPRRDTALKLTGRVTLRIAASESYRG